MSMMTARRRRTFTPEFKARTVDLVRTSGKSVGEVCRELDLTETAVRRLVAQADIDVGRRDGPHVRPARGAEPPTPRKPRATRGTRHLEKSHHAAWAAPPRDGNVRGGCIMGAPCG